MSWEFHTWTSRWGDATTGSIANPLQKPSQTVHSVSGLESTGMDSVEAGSSLTGTKPGKNRRERAAPVSAEEKFSAKPEETAIRPDKPSPRTRIQSQDSGMTALIDRARTSPTRTTGRAIYTDSDFMSQKAGGPWLAQDPPSLLTDFMPSSPIIPQPPYQQRLEKYAHILST